MTKGIRGDTILILSVGAQTSIGRSYLTATAAARCGISGYAEHPYIRDQYGERMIVARATWLNVALPLEQRLVALANGATRDVFAGVRLPRGSRVRLHLALSADRVGGRAAAERVASAVRAAPEGVSFDDDVALVLEGHAGGFAALASAVAVLRAGQASACLVGGVDSYLDADHLEALDGVGRLHSTRTRWGFTPGEAAGFCLLATSATAASFTAPPLAEVEAAAIAHESRLLGARSVNTGEGLSSILREVLSPEERAHHTYCDLNGETYRADEFALAISRTADRFFDVAAFTAAADRWGDVGAASGPLLWAQAAAAWQRGYAQGSVAITWASSADKPLRGAARLRRASRKE